MRKCMAYLMMFAMLVTVLVQTPVQVYAADPNKTADGVLEMRTKSNSLNKGDTVEVTFHVKKEEMLGFKGYLVYDANVLGRMQPITPDYSNTENGGTWQVSYTPASQILEVTPTDKKAAALPANADGLLLTLRFTVDRAATSTTIKLERPDVYYKSGENVASTPYPSGVSLKIDNSKAKKLTLETESVSGYSRIAVPAKFTANDGFTALSVSADFDSTKLVFDSVTVAGTVKGKFNLTNYTVTNSGKTVTANFTTTEEIKTTGVLFYMNFRAVGQSSSSTGTGTSTNTNTGLGSTTVRLYVDSVTNKEESAYVLNDAVSTVSITGKEHTLGDVNGNNKVDLVDALFIIQYYNKARTFTSVELDAADVNKNGTVDLVDALLIMQYYNGVVKSF